jgi:hypothetical protein
MARSRRGRTSAEPHPAALGPLTSSASVRITVDLETLRTLLRGAWAPEISPEEAEKELLAGVA